MGGEAERQLNRQTNSERGRGPRHRTGPGLGRRWDRTARGAWHGATGTQSRGLGWRHRGRAPLAVAEARREAWWRRNGAEPSRAEQSAGQERCAPRERAGAASREAPGAVLEKAGLGGVATRCSSSPPPSSPAPPWGPGAEGGRGKEGAVGKGGAVCRRSAPQPWLQAGEGQEGHRAPIITECRAE